MSWIGGYTLTLVCDAEGHEDQKIATNFRGGDLGEAIGEAVRAGWHVAALTGHCKCPDCFRERRPYPTRLSHNI